MKIDIFAHIFPQKYLAALSKKRAIGPWFQGHLKAIPTLTDLDLRFRIMDEFDDLVQVISLGPPYFEHAAGQEDAVELAKVANDEMAELVARHSDRFVGAVGRLPMNNLAAALKETDRVINDLKFRGIELCSDINGEPLDLPKFRPLYEKMAGYKLPIWIHPDKSPSVPDYVGEERSKYEAFIVFGWPYQTTLAMNRLVYSGILEDYPGLTFITHHCGGMVPYFAQRIAAMYDRAQALFGGAGFERLLPRHPIEYFRRFYGDTVTSGSTPALMCGYSFFGADHILFGTDMPYDTQLGLKAIGDTIRAIERMEISEADKVKIFEGNARGLLHLPM